VTADQLADWIKGIRDTLGDARFTEIVRRYDVYSIDDLLRSDRIAEIFRALNHEAKRKASRPEPDDLGPYPRLRARR
jgi:hypothetical protein